MTRRPDLRPVSRQSISLLFTVAFLLLPAVGHAALGDCSQPVSSGSVPVATDCLFILNTAVGLQTCTPECICAPTGTVPVKATDALLCLNAAVGAPVTLECPCEPVITDGDDFDDNKKDVSRWGDAMLDGNGRLTETSKRLEYTCSSGTADDGADWPWIASALPFAGDWELQVDLVNLTVPSASNQLNSFGFGVVNANDFDDEVYAELYASAYGSGIARNGFYAELLNNGSYVGAADSGGSDVTHGAVRIVFDASTKVLSAFYDLDPSDGYQWFIYGSFGIAGAGGAYGNADWGLAESDVMYAYVYGYSERMKITAGNMWGDNFVVTGETAAP